MATLDDYLTGLKTGLQRTLDESKKPKINMRLERDKKFGSDKEYLRSIVTRKIGYAPEGWFSMQWTPTLERVTVDWFVTKQELLDFLSTLSMNQVLRIHKTTGGAFTKVEKTVFDSITPSEEDNSGG